MLYYLSVVICIVSAYFVSGFNAGYLFVKYASGEDLREKFSGNAGATNAGRVLGRKGFIVAFLGDFIKGLLILVVSRFVGFDHKVLLLLIPACVLGHIFPIQLAFRGGKGMSTIGGALLGYSPLLFALSFPLFLVLIFVTRSRLYGGLTGLLCMPFVAFFLNRDTTESVVLFLTCLLIVMKHRQDIILSLKKPISGK